MNKKMIEFFMIPTIFFVVLIDSQISTLATNLSVFNVIISSHLLVMFAIFFANFVSIRFSLIAFILLGFFYDIYYFGLIGIATTILPFVVCSMYYFFQGVESRRYTYLLILIVSIFQFELISFLFARLFNLTSLSVFIFVFNSLLPSLIFNVIVFLILQPLLELFFGITNKS